MACIQLVGKMIARRVHSVEIGAHVTASVMYNMPGGATDEIACAGIARAAGWFLCIWLQGTTSRSSRPIAT
jgi:hypothetical protein